MLMLSRVHVPLGLALVVGGITLDISGGQAPTMVMSHLAEAVMSAEFWVLLVVIALIIEFGRFATEKDNAKAIVDSITHAGGQHGRAWTLMAGPAVVGLLPMPGGALFSAPFVRQAAEDAQRDGAGEYEPEWMTAVNYWFRHIWEYWWPLYAGVVVAMCVFDMQPLRFVAIQICFSPVAALAGYFFLIRPHLSGLRVEPSSEAPGNRRIVFLGSTLAVVVCCAVFAPFGVQAMAPSLDARLVRLLSMLLGLSLGSIAIVIDEKRRGQIQFLKSLSKPKSLNILFTVAGVLIFQALLEKSNLVGVTCSEMREWGIPEAFAVAALPMLAGVVTGVAVGFAGIALPLVVALMAVPGSTLTPVATLVLSYGFGYMGMMFSPVHICLLVTSDYFSATVMGVMRRILPCGLVVAAFSVLAFFILNSLGL